MESEEIELPQMEECAERQYLAISSYLPLAVLGYQSPVVAEDLGDDDIFAMPGELPGAGVWVRALQVHTHERIVHLVPVHPTEEQLARACQEWWRNVGA